MEVLDNRLSFPPLSFTFISHFLIEKVLVTFYTRKLVRLLGPCYKTGQSRGNRENRHCCRLSFRIKGWQRPKYDAASRQNRREPFEADIVVFYKPTPTLRPTFDFPPPCVSSIPSESGISAQNYRRHDLLSLHRPILVAHRNPF